MRDIWRKEALADLVNLAPGAWLFLTPWIFGFTSEPAASRNAGSAVWRSVRSPLPRSRHSPSGKSGSTSRSVFGSPSRRGLLRFPVIRARRECI